MVKLFGIDVAKEVHDGIKRAGGLPSGTLTHKVPGTRSPGDLGGGTNPTTSTHSFQGTLERKVRRSRGTAVAEPMDVLMIVGNSLSPAVVPAVGDEASIDGTTRTLTELLERDPAGATYEFRVG